MNVKHEKKKHLETTTKNIPFRSGFSLLSISKFTIYLTSQLFCFLCKCQQNNLEAGPPWQIFCRQDPHSGHHITSMLPLPPPHSIPQNPGKTLFLPVLPLVLALRSLLLDLLVNNSFVEQLVSNVVNGKKGVSCPEDWFFTFYTQI